MAGNDLWSLSGAEQARLIRQREVSASEVVASVLKRIEDVEKYAAALVGHTTGIVPAKPGW